MVEKMKSGAILYDAEKVNTSLEMLNAARNDLLETRGFINPYAPPFPKSITCPPYISVIVLISPSGSMATI